MFLGSLLFCLGDFLLLCRLLVRSLGGLYLFGSDLLFSITGCSPGLFCPFFPGYSFDFSCFISVCPAPPVPSASAPSSSFLPPPPVPSVAPVPSAGDLSSRPSSATGGGSLAYTSRLSAVAVAAPYLSGEGDEDSDRDDQDPSSSGCLDNPRVYREVLALIWDFCPAVKPSSSSAKDSSSWFDDFGDPR